MTRDLLLFIFPFRFIQPVLQAKSSKLLPKNVWLLGSKLLV